MSDNRLIKSLFEFIDASPSPWHVVATIETKLIAHGFEKLEETETWRLNPDSGYYVIRGDSSIIFLSPASDLSANRAFISLVHIPTHPG